MAKRIISSVIGFPVLVVIIMIGGWTLQLSLLVLAIIGMGEVYQAVTKKRALVHYIGFVFTIAYYLMLQNLAGSNLLILFSMMIICLLIVSVVFHETVNVLDCSVTVMGFFYVAFLLSFIFLVRADRYGSFFVWLIFIAAWGSDTFAYFTGITIGKHKLTPKLSPKKTVEGSLGGVIGATLIAVVYGLIYSHFVPVEDLNITLFCAVTGLVGSLFSQLGDLAASAIKRYTGVKDYGKIIPGHGGIMDRFDSILFTAPGVYMVMLILLA